jgi:hypothetical protein
MTHSTEQNQREHTINTHTDLAGAGGAGVCYVSPTKQPISLKRLKTLWLLEYVCNSDKVHSDLKHAYYRIARKQLIEDDESLGIPRLLGFRMLLDEVRRSCSCPETLRDFKIRSLELYPLLKKLDELRKGHPKTDLRIMPRLGMMINAFLSHLVELLCQGELDEFLRIWDKKKYVKKLRDHAAAIQLKDEFQRLENEREQLLRTRNYWIKEKKEGEWSAAVGYNIQKRYQSLENTGQATSGYHFEKSLTLLLNELSLYCTNAKQSIGNTFLDVASMNIDFGQYKPIITEDGLLSRKNDAKEIDDERTPNRIVTPSVEHLKKIPFKDNTKRPADVAHERQPVIFKKAKIKMDGRKGGKTVNARDIQFDTEDVYEFQTSDEEEDDDDDDRGDGPESEKRRSLSEGVIGGLLSLGKGMKNTFFGRK